MINKKDILSLRLKMSTDAESLKEKVTPETVYFLKSPIKS